MEHVDIVIIGDYYKLTPDAGYVIRERMSMKTFKEVVTKDLGLYEVAEEGVTPEPTPVPIIPQDPLERAKQRKIAEITAYDKSDAVNSFYLGDAPMWLTVDERQQIATQISASEAARRSEMTRWFGGHDFTFPLATWKQMLVALEVYAGDALNVTEAHKAAVMAMESVEDVEAFDITQGYPAKLNFNVVAQDNNNDD